MYRGSSVVPKPRIRKPFGVFWMVGEHSELVEAGLERPVDGSEETLPALVAINQVRTLVAVSLRFPEQG